MEARTNRQFPLFVFSLLAFTLFAAYFAFCFVIPQTPARLARPSAALIPTFPLWSWIVSLPLPIPNDPRSTAILLVTLSLVTFAGYGLAMFLARKLPIGRTSLILVLFPACAFFLLSAFALPNQNTDIFNYMLRGRLSAVYDKNPYTSAADEIPDDAVYPYASHSYTSGPEWWNFPLWTFIEVVLANFTGEDVVKNLFIFRFAFLLVNIANLALITAILKKINSRFINAGLVLYAWNPITVLLGQGKSDIFAVFFLLLAIYLIVAERKVLAVIPLTLSVLIKLTTLPFAAAYLLMNFNRNRWKEYLLLGSLFAFTVAIFYMNDNLGAFFTTQTLSVIGMSAKSAPDFIRSFLRLAFVGLIFLAGFALRRDTRQILWGWWLLALFFSLFLVNTTKAWYLMTLIALAALIPDWYAVLITCAVSFSGFLLYAWESGFNPAFPAPVGIPLPTILVYIALPVLVLVATGSIVAWKKLQARESSASQPNPPFNFREGGQGG